MNDPHHDAECELIIACALRLDGEAAAVYDDELLDNDVLSTVNALRLPADLRQQWRAFFLLQRAVLKSGATAQWPASPQWRALRTLFLVLAHADVPAGLRRRAYCVAWDRDWRPHLVDYLSRIAAIHASTAYGIPLGLSADDAELATWRSYHTEWLLFQDIHRR